MSKFSSKQTIAKPKSAIATTKIRTKTFEGGGAYTRDAKSDLFLLAVTSMVGENTFYESAKTRDNRFNDLVRQVTADDPDWVARFVPFLRNEMNMRSASVVMACEYVAAQGSNGRKVVDSACSRADEPAEILGYWMAHYGRAIPKPIKRGVADAALRLYNEISSIKYDGSSRDIRMGDVIDLVHPKPKANWQSLLFKYLIDKRHNREDLVVPEGLKKLTADAYLAKIDVKKRRDWLSEDGSEYFKQAGMTWERLSGWLQSPMDAKAWEAIIPSMGIMALIRNLRNFDEAGVSDDVAEKICKRLMDTDQIAGSRQFPYRFWTAYRESSGSMRWASALEKASTLACSNIPHVGGKTLVVVDVSGSMNEPISNRGTVMRWEIAGVIAGGLAKACKQVDLVAFGQYNKKVEFGKPGSILRAVQKIQKIQHSGELNHSTFGHTAIRDHWDGHDRVVIVTDDQMHDSIEYYKTYNSMYGHRYGMTEGVDVSHVPTIYTFNLAGYAPSSMESGVNGRYTLGGFSDAAFRLFSLLENHRNASWPF